MSNEVLSGGKWNTQKLIAALGKALPSPRRDDAVLGGNNPPLIDAAVLGTGKLFAQRFDQFNNEAKLVHKNNRHYMRLLLTPEVSLIRHRRAMPMSDIKLKVLVAGNGLGDDEYWQDQYWQFAGYLTHDGPLFGHTAKYNPARCERELRAIALRALSQQKSRP